MTSAKLSIIMTNYNHSKYIAGALKAIVDQSLQPFEVFVCDDGSTDNSVEIIQRFIDKYPFVHLIKNDTNLGMFAGVDRLMSLVSGDYLYSAAADDAILPGFFEKSMKLLQQYPQAGLCSALAISMDEDGRSRGIFKTPIVSGKPRFFSADQVQKIFLEQGCWIFGVSAIFRRDYLLEAGGFRKDLHSFCDGFVEHVLALKHGACFIPEPLVAWRRLGNSYSATIASDPETTSQWISHAKFLMQTTYKNIFSSRFIERWERRELVNYQLWRDFSFKNAHLEQRFCAKDSKNFFFRKLLSVAKVFLRIQYAILKGYRYYRAGLPFEQLLIQKLKNFWRSFSISIKSYAN